MIKTTCFPKYTGKSNSIVDALHAVGAKDTSKAYRKKIAKLNGISNYTCDATQNMKMLSKLKAGNLIKNVTEVLVMREKFIKKLQEYQPVLKKYGNLLHYSWDDAASTFEKAKARLKDGKTTGITCVVPCRWALKDIGIGPSGFYAKDGSFKNCYKGDITKHTKRITSGSAVGQTIKQAVEEKLLKPGDILCFKGKTHTFVYSGNGFFVYDGGRSAKWAKDGILVDYSKHHANDIISEVIRWTD